MLDNLNAFLLAAASTVQNQLTYETRRAVIIAFGVLMTLASIAIIVIIMLQKGTNDNVGVISGASDTYYGKNKEHNKESNLKKATFGLFAFIIVCAIICVVIGVVGNE